MKTAMLLLILLAAGCDKQATDDDAAASCSAAVARAVDATLAKRKAGALAKHPNAPQQIESIAPKLRASLNALCMKDRWPPKVTTCLSTATDNIAKCKEGLTSEQRGRYTRATMDVMTQLAPPSGGTK
jgi:hypothetical protein